VLGLVFFCYWLVPVGTYLLIGTHLPVMVASLALAGGWGLGLMALAQRLHPAGEKVGVLVAVLLAVWMVAHNRPDIVSHTQDDTGQRLIAAAAALPDTAPILVESWGPRYFALAVGKWVTGELAEARLIDARGNLEGVVAAALPPSPLYTTPYLLYQNPPALWAERLARPVTVESAGPGLIALYPEPRLLPTLPAAGPTEIELQTVTARQEGAMVYVMAEWLAVQKPSVNYHVFVHLTDQPDIDGPDDILAQGDQQNPVYGFSPTTTWVVGQLVRDDYLLTIPDDRQPTQIFIGLYMTTEDGGFVNILRQAVPLAGQ